MIFGGNNRKGKFDEVNRSIFIYAEKYMSSKVHTMNELEHSARDIDNLKKKSRDLNEEIRETDRAIEKKKKMIKSDIHAFQGLQFELSACKRDETKGSIKRRFKSLLKMLGEVNNSSFVRYFSEIQNTVSVFEGKKEEYKSIMLRIKEKSSKSLQLEVSLKDRHDSILKSELTIEKISQEKSLQSNQCEVSVDSVEKNEVSLGELKRLVMDCEKKNSILKSKKDELLKAEVECCEEIRRLNEIDSQRSSSMVNEFQNVLRKHFHGGITQKNKVTEEKLQDIGQRLGKVRKEIERKKRELLFTKEKLGIREEKNTNVRTEALSKGNLITATQNEKMEMKARNEQYQNSSRDADERIPQYFKKVQEYHFTKKKKMEELMIANSNLENQLHSTHSKKRKRGNATRRFEATKSQVETRKANLGAVSKVSDEVEKLVVQFREKLNYFANHMRNFEVDYAGVGHARMNEIEEEGTGSFQGMKEYHEMEGRKGKEMEFESTRARALTETEEFMKNLELEYETLAAKESPPIAQRSTNNVSLNFKNMESMLAQGDGGGVNIDEDLSYLGNEGEFQFEDDEEDERGRKRRKLSDGTFNEVSHTPKKAKKSENEIGGMSDLELEFNLDDVFGNDSDNSALSTPVRHSTALSTPHSNGTPNNLLDILNPSTRKKKKKAKGKKKKVSVIPLHFEETKPKKKRRKRKRSNEPRKKKTKKTRKSKKSKKKKKKMVKEADDLDIDFEDSIDLSVFDF